MIYPGGVLFIQLLHRKRKKQSLKAVLPGYLYRGEAAGTIHAFFTSERDFLFRSVDLSFQM